ncbi:MAG: hypothetical protein OWV35_07995, partial [Firmicutes bacterium]|nr:hypothetical protein [Bacillota bacterium]
IRVPAGGPTLLYFMSAQCASCIAGEEQLAALRPRLPAGVHLVSLDVTPGYDTAAALAALARRAGAGWPQAFATPAILTAYRVTALDQVAVISRQGHLLYDGPLPSDRRLLALMAAAAR